MPDYLVIFGAAVRPDGSPSGTLRRRVEAAYDWGKKLSDPVYLPTGGQGRYGPPEAQVMRALLLSAGVPDARVLVEEHATDTLSSVLACQQILRAKGDATHVFVCSSPYHVPRCRLLFRIVGVPTAPAPMPSDRPALGIGKWLWYWIRDLVALAYDVAILLWRNLGPGRK